MQRPYVEGGWNGKYYLPESEKLIECKGNDWCDFTCKGKFVDYKPLPKGKLRKRNHAKSRFFIFDPKMNDFVSDRSTWTDITEWRYV